MSKRWLKERRVGGNKSEINGFVINEKIRDERRWESERDQGTKREDNDDEM